MLRTEAIVRPTKQDGLRAYDIFHVWPDDYVKMGVKWSSWIFAFLAEPGTAHVKIWSPGRGVETRLLTWGAEFCLPSNGWGVVTAVAENDVPLHVFWELSAGKA